jgi:hypothetical protein
MLIHFEGGGPLDGGIEDVPVVIPGFPYTVEVNGMVHFYGASQYASKEDHGAIYQYQGAMPKKEVKKNAH